MGTLRMSEKERRRLEVLSRVRDDEITLAKAAELMHLSYRQAKRVYRRYKEQGDEGLAHRLRGRESNNAAAVERRARIVEAFRARYPDFGPTLATEYLATEEGETVAVETMRRWLIDAGLWQPGKRRVVKHRRWRARREHRGELVQMDGSLHDWFEGRREQAVLMVIVDDATNETAARFYERETTAAAMNIFKRYVLKNGLPRGLYVDRHSIYKTTRDATVDETLAAEPPLTQFGMAMDELGVDLILAYSPQAKGRVERMNGTLQDRLVKAMRLLGICDLGTANAFLDAEFLPDLNRRFAVVAAKPADLHRPLGDHVPLDRILGFREVRIVRSDWTLSWRNRWFQLTGTDRNHGLVGRKAQVIEELDGTLHVLYAGRELTWTELPERPRPPKRTGPARQARLPWKPPPNHPWRQYHNPPSLPTAS